MPRFLLRRLLIAPLVLLALATATFFLIRLAPGSPFAGEREYSPETEQALMARYRLDRPAGIQYLYFLGGLVQGDLGPSLKHRGRSVNEIIATHLPVSACLGGLALVVALCGGLAAGMVAAVRARRWLDYAVMSEKLKIKFEDYFASELASLSDLEADGLLKRSATNLEISALGRLFLRIIAMRFDAYLTKAAPRGFSKTV